MGDHSGNDVSQMEANTSWIVASKQRTSNIEKAISETNTKLPDLKSRPKDIGTHPYN